VTIQEVLREWRAHLPPRPPRRGLRGRAGVGLSWLAFALVYASALAIVIGFPAAAVVILLRLVNR